MADCHCYTMRFFIFGDFFRVLATAWSPPLLFFCLVVGERSLKHRNICDLRVLTWDNALCFIGYIINCWLRLYYVFKTIKFEQFLLFGVHFSPTSRHANEIYMYLYISIRLNYFQIHFLILMHVFLFAIFDSGRKRRDRGECYWILSMFMWMCSILSLMNCLIESRSDDEKK